MHNIAEKLSLQLTMLNACRMKSSGKSPQCCFPVTLTCCIKVWATEVPNGLMCRIALFLYQGTNLSRWLSLLFFNPLPAPTNKCWRSFTGTPDNKHWRSEDLFWQQTPCLARNTTYWITFLRLMVYPGARLLTFAWMIQKPRWIKLVAFSMNRGSGIKVGPGFGFVTVKLKKKTRISFTQQCPWQTCKICWSH